MMKTVNFKKFGAALIIYLIVVGCKISAQNKIDNKALAIREALVEGHKYTSTILLDKEGKARGDYNMFSGRWEAYESAWHTAQLIYGLVEANKVLNQAEILKTARKAGDWWISLEMKTPPELEGMLYAIHGGPLDELINFTTITDGTNGIFELYRATGEKKYAETAKGAGDWMLKHMYIPDEALFYNILDPKTGEIWKDKSPHHNTKTPIITQVARPNNEGYLYYDLFLYSGENKYKEVFINLCDGLVKRQGPEGLWMDFEPNEQDNKSGKVHPRFNTWYAESLLKGYELTGNNDYLDAAIKTARYLTKMQQKDGTIYYFNYLDGFFREGSVCGSAVSFAGILWLELQKLGYNEFDESIEKSLNWVLANRFPADHPDPNLAGGFIETRSKRDQEQHIIHVRDIATAFGMRFLSKYYKFYYGI